MTLDKPEPSAERCVLQFAVLVAEYTGQRKIADMVCPTVAFPLEMFKGELMNREVVPAVIARASLLLIQLGFLGSLSISGLQGI